MILVRLYHILEYQKHFARKIDKRTYRTRDRSESNQLFFFWEKTLTLKKE